MEARLEYAQHYEPVTECGFITNDKWGFTIGYSPDALVCAKGLFEAKSRGQKHQIRTLCDYVSADTIDPDYMIQCQTGLLVADDREWIDLSSYSGGLPMATVRVYPDAKIQAAILAAATEFESRLNAASEKYTAVLASKARLIETKRRERGDII